MRRAAMQTAMMRLPARTVQNMPERFSRHPITGLQPASINPEANQKRDSEAR